MAYYYTIEEMDGTGQATIKDIDWNEAIHVDSMDLRKYDSFEEERQATSSYYVKRWRILYR